MDYDKLAKGSFWKGDLDLNLQLEIRGRKSLGGLKYGKGRFPIDGFEDGRAR